MKSYQIFLLGLFKFLAIHPVVVEICHARSEWRTDDRRTNTAITGAAGMDKNRRKVMFPVLQSGAGKYHPIVSQKLGLFLLHQRFGYSAYFMLPKSFFAWTEPTITNKKG